VQTWKAIRRVFKAAGGSCGKKEGGAQNDDIEGGGNAWGIGSGGKQDGVWPELKSKDKDAPP